MSESRNTTLSIMTFDGQYQNLKMSPLRISALALNVSDKLAFTIVYLDIPGQRHAAQQT